MLDRPQKVFEGTVITSGGTRSFSFSFRCCRDRATAELCCFVEGWNGMIDTYQPIASKCISWKQAYKCYVGL